MKYLVFSGSRVVAALAWSSAAHGLTCRDRYAGENLRTLLERRVAELPPRRSRCAMRCLAICRTICALVVLDWRVKNDISWFDRTGSLLSPPKSVSVGQRLTARKPKRGSSKGWELPSA